MASEGKPVVLSVRGLAVRTSACAILEGINFELHEHEIVSIAGPSGAGKSTLLRAVNGLAQEMSGMKVTGEIFYRGRNALRGMDREDLRKKIGMVFQKPCVYPGSIERNVLFGARHHLRLNGRQKKLLAERVLRQAHLWEEVSDRLHRPASELSLGQKQRLTFARALAVDPDILLLDEPTSSLDPHSTEAIEKTLLELRESKSILLVTHHMRQARDLSSRILLLSRTNGVGRLAVTEEGYFQSYRS